MGPWHEWQENMAGEIALPTTNATMPTIALPTTTVTTAVTGNAITFLDAQGRRCTELVHARDAPRTGMLVADPDCERARAARSVLRLAELAYARHAAAIATHEITTGDPLDVRYDEVSLRELLVRDEESRRESSARCRFITIAQRAAISALWSAELRARVEASTERDRERERRRVMIEIEAE